MNFEVGKFYKLDEIRKQMGGPLLASFATHKNQLLYIKIKQDRFNPNLPNEIWVRDGKNTRNTVSEWLKAKTSVPFFWRPKRHKETTWLYQGNIKPVSYSVVTGEENIAFKIQTTFE